jgi:hypothetical protein
VKKQRTPKKRQKMTAVRAQIRGDKREAEKAHKEEARRSQPRPERA